MEPPADSTEVPGHPHPSAASPTLTLEELEQRCEDLRTLLLATLVALLLLALGLNLYLGKEMRAVRARISETRPVLQRMEVEFQKKEPNMGLFVAALQSFAFTNPEFQPVLNRYRVVLPQFFPPTAPINTSNPLPRPGSTAPAAPARPAASPSPRPAAK